MAKLARLNQGFILQPVMGEDLCTMSRFLGKRWFAQENSDFTVNIPENDFNMNQPGVYCSTVSF